MGSRLRQLPNNHKIEDLLDSLNSQEEVSVVGYSDDVFSFLTFFKFEPGNNLISKKLMYNLYKRWSNVCYSKVEFGLKIADYFEAHVKGPKTFWKVNHNSLQVNEFLLKYLEKKSIDKTKYPRWKKHYEDYLKFYSIKKGNKWIQSYVLKHLYDKWCYDNNRVSLLSSNQFFNFCKLYFDYKRNTDSRMQWFGVNEEFMNTIPKTTLNTIHQAWNKKHGKRKKSANKTSGAKTRIKS
jgi:hypothetical protein